MSVQSEMPCWKIIQCKKKHTCRSAENDKMTCWEMVEANDVRSFHNCVDCLVYLAKHEDSILTEEEFCSILEQRKKLYSHSRV